MFIFVTLFVLTPMLETLTRGTSEDSIWALSAVLFLANLTFHVYNSDSTNNIKHYGSLSTNAAIFASVALASKLETRQKPETRTIIETRRTCTNMHVFGSCRSLSSGLRSFL